MDRRSPAWIEQDRINQKTARLTDEEQRVLFRGPVDQGLVSIGVGEGEDLLVREWAVLIEQAFLKEREKPPFIGPKTQAEMERAFLLAPILDSDLKHYSEGEPIMATTNEMGIAAGQPDYYERLFMAELHRDLLEGIARGQFNFPLPNGTHTRTLDLADTGALSGMIEFADFSIDFLQNLPPPETYANAREKDFAEKKRAYLAEALHIFATGRRGKRDAQLAQDPTFVSLMKDSISWLKNEALPAIQDAERAVRVNTWAAAPTKQSPVSIPVAEPPKEQEKPTPPSMTYAELYKAETDAMAARSSGLAKWAKAFPAMAQYGVVSFENKEVTNLTGEVVPETVVNKTVPLTPVNDAPQIDLQQQVELSQTDAPLAKANLMTGHFAATLTAMMDAMPIFSVYSPEQRQNLAHGLAQECLGNKKFLTKSVRNAAHVDLRRELKDGVTKALLQASQNYKNQVAAIELPEGQPTGVKKFLMKGYKELRDLAYNAVSNAGLFSQLAAELIEAHAQAATASITNPSHPEPIAPVADPHPIAESDAPGAEPLAQLVAKRIAALPAQAQTMVYNLATQLGQAAYRFIGGQAAAMAHNVSVPPLPAVELALAFWDDPQTALSLNKTVRADGTRKRARFLVEKALTQTADKLARLAVRGRGPGPEFFVDQSPATLRDQSVGFMDVSSHVNAKSLFVSAFINCATDIQMDLAKKAVAPLEDGKKVAPSDLADMSKAQVTKGAFRAAASGVFKRVVAVVQRVGKPFMSQKKAQLTPTS